MTQPYRRRPSTTTPALLGGGGARPPGSTRFCDLRRKPLIPFTIHFVNQALAGTIGRLVSGDGGVANARRCPRHPAIKQHFDRPCSGALPVRTHPPRGKRNPDGPRPLRDGSIAGSAVSPQAKPHRGETGRAWAKRCIISLFLIIQSIKWLKGKSPGIRGRRCGPGLTRYRSITAESLIPVGASLFAHVYQLGVSRGKTWHCNSNLRAPR